MINKWKYAAAAALLVASMASPAFAQAFDPGVGTGNVTGSYYSGNGALHLGRANQQSEFAARRSGLSSFAMIPGDPGSSFSPGARGGGSLGYNENLRLDH